MAPVVSKQAAGPGIPEAYDPIQTTGVHHSSASLPQQLNNARLSRNVTQKQSRAESGGRREDPNPPSEGPEDRPPFS